MATQGIRFQTVPPRTQVKSTDLALGLALQSTYQGRGNWGRAVNTNPSKLRGGLNGLALVALAGPVSNIVFTVVLALAAVFLARPFPAAA